jgi:hypothetical protein
MSYGGYGISCVDTAASSIRNVNYILYIVLIHLVIIFKNNFVIRFEFFHSSDCWRDFLYYNAV